MHGDGWSDAVVGYMRAMELMLRAKTRGEARKEVIRGFPSISTASPIYGFVPINLA
jgi:hypothetical protein